MSVQKESLVLGLHGKELKPLLEQKGATWLSFASEVSLANAPELPRAKALIIDARAMISRQVEELYYTLRDLSDDTKVLLWAPQLSALEVRKNLQIGYSDVVLSYDPNDVLKTLVELEKKADISVEARPKKGTKKSQSKSLAGLHSRSSKMWSIFDTAKRVAKTDATVLIQGETGTGKELLARAVHELSGRTGNFVVLNCGAVAENLVDSELFGHTKGSFTGATHNKLGLFRHADKGTIMLDEIGNIPLEAQYRLLRVLQENAVRPVGGHEEIPIDVRVVAATNAPLEDLIARGRFREDLYYRLNVINMILPPLRERPKDIVFLFSHFVRNLREQYDMDRPQMSDGFLHAMQTYPWPGNVRELENFTERLLLTHRDGELQREDFERLTRNFHGKDEFGQSLPTSTPSTGISYPEPTPPVASTAPREHFRPNPVPVLTQPQPVGESYVPPAREIPSEIPQSTPTPALREPELESVEPLISDARSITEELWGDEPQDLSDHHSLNNDNPLRLEILVDPDKALDDIVEPLLAQLEEIYFDACLRKFNGRIAKTAEHAGINRRTLLRKMKKLGIEKSKYRG